MHEKRKEQGESVSPQLVDTNEHEHKHVRLTIEQRRQNKETRRGKSKLNFILKLFFFPSTVFFFYSHPHVNISTSIPISPPLRSFLHDDESDCAVIVRTRSEIHREESAKKKRAAKVKVLAGENRTKKNCYK